MKTIYFVERTDELIAYDNLEDALIIKMLIGGRIIKLNIYDIPYRIMNFCKEL